MKSLCVLEFYTPSDEVRGKTRRYLYEIRPNVFVGRISTSVRDTLWREIENCNTKATLIYTSATEQGFSVKTSGETNKFTDFDGVLMPSVKKSILSLSSLYAKPQKKLVDHLTDVGVIAEALMKKGRANHIMRVLSERFEIDQDKLISSISFLCALHDIGKAHPGFQKALAEKSELIGDTLDKMMDSGMILSEDETIRHERYSKEIVKEHLSHHEGCSEEISELFSCILLFHHQNKGSGIIDSMNEIGIDQKRLIEWHHVQQEIISIIAKKWIFYPEVGRISGNIGINGALYIFLSILVTSDWIASSKEWNDCLKENDNDPVKSAEQFICKNLLDYVPIGEQFKGIKWEDVFDFPMNELQKTLSTMDIHDSDLLLLEYPCGYGKTASALLAMSKFWKNSGGCIFVTPTMITAKAMRDEVKGIAERAGLEIEIPEFDSSVMWNEEKEGIIPGDLWVNRSRHQMLYPFAVGTVDQVLKCILHYRYSCIGTLGLSDKVVIIDEVHAYDAYMIEEIKSLIRWCRFFKIPVILLSATLPTETKKELFKAAGMKSGQDISNEYPLISVIKDKQLIQKVTVCNGRTFPVKTTTVNDLQEYMFQEALTHKKGSLALIAPTVDDAFELYDRVKENVHDCEVILYHGRDTISHKRQKISKLLHLLGKDKSNRPDKVIVIATSIIEQSLNVDFDRMVTALAPVDLLIQRLGRVWRFSENSTEKNPFVIVVPEEYKALLKIYREKELLDKTVDAFRNTDTINTVSDVRNLIDEVYNGFESSKDESSRCYAGYNCLSNPFMDESIIVKGEDDAYRQFDKKLPQTRETTYPTVQIAILDHEPMETIDYDAVCKIMQNNVINVAEYKINDFAPYENKINPLKNVKVFIGDKNLSITGITGEQMTLTEDGLRFKV